ncbi:glycerate kinase type-2 family protein [Rhodohalobacter mucosus]|uniref:Hydroxypyruvate reductase n=1 Tax=Rhodohalobacter mucosus TaxID=2079485 RepID=A0A316TWX7_9BACT|nr:DUF4147 domain-containing protein [Rhodohalobacter mucosus]PWN07082.1 hypothetical protein DDZ15_07385 [Rhodohalobacter mucosus]
MAEYLLESFNIWREIIRKVDPSEVLFESISLQPDSNGLRVQSESIPMPDHSAIYLAGAGKASAGMALGAENALNEHLKDGLVISTPNPFHQPQKTRVLIGSHPYPDRASFQATQQLIRYIRELPSGSTLINLISGGTSSLLCRPAAPIPEEDIQQLYRQLVTSGAEIGQINTVRKAVSSVKGGRMLQFMKHLNVIDLIISDVPDDNVEDIGSGPTTPQNISTREAKTILTGRSLWNKIPDSVRNHIQSRSEAESLSNQEKTAESGHHPQFILSSARIVSSEACRLLEEHGFEASREPEPWSGSINDFEKLIRKRLDTMLNSNNRPAAHVFYGECTLKVTGEGKGGRNQELALRMAQHLSSFDRKILFLSAGTDGIDGSTDAAGAIVDETTWRSGEKRNADPAGALADNDSYNFFNDTPWHIKTGPTGNNVMDIQILMLP